jgi:hypothetical protein
MVCRSLICVGLALVPAVASALPNPAGQSSITMPATGVVCDGTNQLCYDRNGLSLPLTGRYVGQYDERTAQQNFGYRLPYAVLNSATACSAKRIKPAAGARRTASG